MAGAGPYNFNENLMGRPMFWIVIGQLAAWFIFDSGTAYQHSHPYPTSSQSPPPNNLTMSTIY